MWFVLLLLQCFCSYLKLLPSYPLVSILLIFKSPNDVTSSTKYFCWPLISHNTFYDFLMALTLLLTLLSVYFSSLLLLNIMDLNLWSASVLLDVSIGVFTGTQFALDGFKRRDFNEVATYRGEDRQSWGRKQGQRAPAVWQHGEAITTVRAGGGREKGKGYRRGWWPRAQAAMQLLRGIWCRGGREWERNILTLPSTLWSLEPAKICSKGARLASARLSLPCAEQGSEGWGIADGE